MKQRVQGIVIGILIALILSNATLVAASVTVARSITYGIRVNLNGEMLQFDENSRPFVMDGRTFLPVRAIAEAVGVPVNFDANTNTVYLGAAPPVDSRRPLNEAAPLFDAHSRQDDPARGRPPSSSVQMQDAVSMGGSLYRNAVTYNSRYTSRPVFSYVGTATHYSLHNLNGQFIMLTGHVGRVDDSDMRDAIVRIYGNDQLLYTQNLVASDLPTPISLYVEGVRLLKIEIEYSVSTTFQETRNMSYAFVGYVE